MNRTQIEWVVNPDGSQGFTWNPVVGCSGPCGYCYGRNRYAPRIAHLCGQFPTPQQVRDFGLDPDKSLCGNYWPHLHEERLEDPLKRKKAATIFLGSMADLWDPHVPLAWRQRIWDVVERTPQHTYLILTQQPQNITRSEAAAMWRQYNVWLGVSIPDFERMYLAIDLHRIYDGHKFISFEPLREELPFSSSTFYIWPADWFIIGAQTGPGARQPQEDWVRRLIATLPDRPLFMKDNLDWPEPKPRALPYLEERGD